MELNMFCIQNQLYGPTNNNVHIESTLGLILCVEGNCVASCLILFISVSQRKVLRKLRVLLLFYLETRVHSPDSLVSCIIVPTCGPSQLFHSSGAELDQLFMDAPSFEVSIDSESGKRLVDVVHEAGVFSSLGK